MLGFSKAVRRFQLYIYLCTAFILFWSAIPLASGAFVAFALVGSFAPALAAVMITAVVGGRKGLSMLFGRFAPRQVSGRWYVLALGIPILTCGVIAGASLVMGSKPSILTGPAMILMVVVFIFAAGEELGWRGYMLPRLLERRSPLAAGLIMGVIHACYHLPLWLAPDTIPPAYSFLSFFLTSLALGILWVWLYLYSSGSILVATLFHGAFNAAGNILFGGINPAHLSLLLPISFGLAAGMVFVADRSKLVTRYSAD